MFGRTALDFSICCGAPTGGGGRLLHDVPDADPSPDLAHGDCDELVRLEAHTQHTL